MTELAEQRGFRYKGTDFRFSPRDITFSADATNVSRLLGADQQHALGKPLPKGGISFITLNVAHDCNMACPYCFAKQGLYGGVARQLMTTEQARKSVDWLFEQSGDKPEVYLRFLGGEPMMNLPVIRDACEYASARAVETGKKIYFSINTNGTIFNNEVADLLRDHHMTVSISMDGTRAAHNTHRIYRNGRGTHAAVVKNVKKFLEQDPDTMVNATLTGANLDVDEYAAHFRELGIRFVRFALVGTALDDIAVHAQDRLDRVILAYDRLAEQYWRDLDRGDIWYMADFYKYMNGLRTGEKRYNRCGAGTSYVNVDVSGNVNLCHRFTTDGTQRVGSVERKAIEVPLGIRRRNQLDENNEAIPSGATVSKLTGQPGVMHLKLLGEKEKIDDRKRVPLDLHRQLDGSPFFTPGEDAYANVCHGCDIRHLCGGSCFHDGEILHGDLLGGPDAFKCAIDRHLARITMWLLDKVVSKDPSILEELDRLHLRSQQHHAD